MSKMNIMRAIRLKCIDCCCGFHSEVKLCTKGPDSKVPCPLWGYRFGKDTDRKKMTDEYRVILGARIRKTVRSVEENSAIAARAAIGASPQ